MNLSEISQFLSESTIRGITAGAFIIMIFLSLIVYFGKLGIYFLLKLLSYKQHIKDVLLDHSIDLKQNDNLLKIVGGLCVFVVAILSNNPWTYTMSLFIGGLIIASEDFMKKLVIIMRSESKDIKDNLKVVSEATPAEREQKIQDEKNQEDNLVNPSLPGEGKPSVTNVMDDKTFVEIQKKRLQAIKETEQKTLTYLKSLYGVQFLENAKIETEKGFVIADGYISSDNKVFEIKVTNTPSLIRFYLDRIVKQYRRVLPDIEIVCVFVVNRKVTQDMIKLIASETRRYQRVSISIMSNIDGKLELVAFI